ncbi:MAG: HAD family hydrolase [Lentisphaeria bacterium]|nr:HAD family hydrolase [Lentisphaeria bacterium]
MSKDLYISDLDGTLLNPKGQFVANAHKRLKSLLQIGLPFTFATARCLQASKEILGDLPIQIPIIQVNGSHITEYQTGKNFKINFIEETVVQRILDLGYSMSLLPFLSVHTDSDYIYYKESQNSGMRWYLAERINAQDQRFQKSKNFNEYNANVTSITYMNRCEVLAPLHKKVKYLYPKCNIQFYENPYQIGWFWLSIQAPESTKGHALKALSEIVNIPVSAMTVFGDGANDIEMFQQAGRSIAVANASPELKQYADLEIPHHGSYSVLDFLEKEFLSS